MHRVGDCVCNNCLRVVVGRRLERGIYVRCFIWCVKRTTRMECDICGPDDLSGERHDACEAEWYKRANDKKCTKCGTGDASSGYWCSTCGPESPYLNYPGGC